MAVDSFSMRAAYRIPGREERFKTLTGKDAPVIEYLDQQESAHQFLASVMSLVDASIDAYQRRGFTSLAVSFGCTGGQHRSVYFAEQLAKRLSGRNGVEVRGAASGVGEYEQMKAMILAAGLGTRLRPLTDDRPKALVEVAGRTMLEITLSRLRAFDVRDVIINVHHFADMILEYLKANDNFGMRIEVSREEVLLDTGGGLKKAAYFFLEDSERLRKPVHFAQCGRRSAPLIFGAWCNFILKIRRSPLWPCKTERRPDTCSSTSSFSFAAVDPETIGRMNLFDLHSRRRR